MSKIKEGENVKLLTYDEQLSEETYKVVQLLDKHSVKLESPTGVHLNVHKCRIRRGEEKMSEEQKDTITKPKKTKSKPKATPFDVLKWRTECGGTCLQKKCEFDHTNYKLIALVCINEEMGFYHTINTYEYPDGTISVGKNTTGSKYPLKGKKVNKKTKNDDGSIATLKGSKTAEEIKTQYEKKGYTAIV